MESPNPLLQLVPSRIEKLRERLGDYLWTDEKPVRVQGGPVNESFLSLADGMQQSMREVVPGEWFGAPGGAWQQRWFRLDIDAPAPSETGRRFLHWDCNGETTVYLDGTAYAGLDIAHTYIRLPDHACTFWLDCGTYQTGVWHPGRAIARDGLCFLDAHTAVRDELAWKVFWDLDILGQWMEHLLRRDGLGKIFEPGSPTPEIAAVDPVLRRALRMLDEAHEAWELGGMAALEKAAASIYAEFPAEPWQMQATFAGHSHLDLVWLWPEEVGERKTVHTMATALRLLEEYPEYRFMWTPPVSYDVAERRDPEMREKISEALAAGRWETTGGAWVETDTLLMGGESLARALVLGQRKYEDVRGEPSRVLWLPDCFGFSVNLPQLLRLAGVRYFATTKLDWNALTEFPHHTFHWRAPDGSTVLAHHLTPFFTGDFTGSLVKMARAYRQSDVNRELMSYAGIGDGGGGTTVAAIEQMRRLDNLAGVPRARWGGVEDWFERTEGLADRLPVHDGELFLELHRGIHTSQAGFKDRFRCLESALQSWEALRAVSGAGPVPEEHWQRLAFAQFHDILPGSSIRLAYEQMGPELERRTSDIETRTREELAKRADVDPDADGITVFNPLPIDRHVVVADRDGNPVSLAIKGLETVSVPNVAHVGPTCTGADLGPRSVTGDITASGTVLDNGIIRAEFDERGRLCRVSDHWGDWPLAGPCEFALHPDHPPHADAWEIDYTTVHRVLGVAGDMTLSVQSEGPVRAILRGEAAVGDKSRLQVDYILDRDANCLRIESCIEWNEESRLLKLRVPGALRGRNAWYGAPYGVVARPQWPASTHEAAMWEVPATRWAAAPNDAGNDGLLLLFDRARGVSCHGGTLALSLLRAPVYPTAEGMQGEGTPEAGQGDRGDHGRHVVRLALSRFGGLAGDRGLPPPVALADSLFAPLVVVPGRARRPVPSPFRVDGLPSAVPSWVLPATEEGIIVRLVESAGCRGDVKLTFADAPSTVEAVDLLERPMSAVDIRRTNDKTVECRINPYQVLSLRVRRTVDR